MLPLLSEKLTLKPVIMKGALYPKENSRETLWLFIEDTFKEGGTLIMNAHFQSLSNPAQELKNALWC